MRANLWGRVSVLASIVASAAAANAADLAVKAPPYKAPPPVILSDWAGFYIGANGGGGWSSNKFDFNPALNTKATGGVYGGQVGYNWQFGSVVAGVEGDFDGASLSKTDAGRNSQKTDELATARARLGYVLVPNLLAYGTGGYGYGHETFTTANGVTTHGNENGWVAGGGLEYKVWGPLLARAEYLHYGLGPTNVQVQGAVMPNDRIRNSLDVVRGGLSYKF